MDSNVLGVPGSLLLTMLVVVVWIVLCVWLKRGRPNRWLKLSVAGVITLFTAAWLTGLVQLAREQARDTEVKRVEMERAATQLLYENKHPKR